MDLFEEKFDGLKDLRKAQVDIKSEMDAMIDAVKNSEKYKELSDERGVVDGKISQLESEIRNTALAIFMQSGEKKPHKFIQVKTFHRFKVLDLNKVRSFVDAKLRDALIVDMKKVEDYAKKIGPVDGTEIVEENQAQISTKLE